MTKERFSTSWFSAGGELKLLKRLFRNQPVEQQTITTDGLASHDVALEQLDLKQIHRPGRFRENDRIENFHLPIRKQERRQQRCKTLASAERLLTTHAAIYNSQRHLVSRITLCRFGAAVDAVWAIATALFREGRAVVDLPHLS